MVSCAPTLGYLVPSHWFHWSQPLVPRAPTCDFLDQNHSFPGAQQVVSCAPSIGFLDTSHWFHRLNPLISWTPKSAFLDVIHWLTKQQPIISWTPQCGGLSKPIVGVQVINGWVSMTLMTSAKENHGSVPRSQGLVSSSWGTGKPWLGSGQAWLGSRTSLHGAQVTNRQVTSVPCPGRQLLVSRNCMAWSPGFQWLCRRKPMVGDQGSHGWVLVDPCRMFRTSMLGGQETNS